MIKTICISNQKGGVGKTTTAINLSSALALEGYKVLLVDFDPQGNTSSGLGLKPDDYAHANIYHVMVEDLPIEEAIYRTQIDQLDLCPANNDLSGAELELVNAIGRELKLKNALRKSFPYYDFIFIDCPPSLGVLTVNALVAANAYLIPMQCEYFAMEGLSNFLNVIKVVQNSLNADLSLEGIVLTMFDSRNNLSRQVSAEIRSHFKGAIFDSVIPRNVRLSECPSFGKPVMLYDANSSGSKAYTKLAKEFVTKYPKVQHTVPGVSLVGEPVQSTEEMIQNAEKAEAGLIAEKEKNEATLTTPQAQPEGSNNE
jgi:chromosome partitioning protein